MNFFGARKAKLFLKHKNYKKFCVFSYQKFWGKKRRKIIANFGEIVDGVDVDTSGIDPKPLGGTDLLLRGSTEPGGRREG